MVIGIQDVDVYDLVELDIFMKFTLSTLRVTSSPWIGSPAGNENSKINVYEKRRT